MFVCCLKVCLAWKTISCQTDKGNRLNMSNFRRVNLCGGCRYVYTLASEKKKESPLAKRSHSLFKHYIILEIVENGRRAEELLQ